MSIQVNNTTPTPMHVDKIVSTEMGRLLGRKVSAFDIITVLHNARQLNHQGRSIGHDVLFAKLRAITEKTKDVAAILKSESVRTASTGSLKATFTLLTGLTYLSIGLNLFSKTDAKAWINLFNTLSTISDTSDGAIRSSQDAEQTQRKQLAELANMTYQVYKSFRDNLRDEDMATARTINELLQSLLDMQRALLK